jgi:2-polyprenyl-3-methyl-5-hydroxy-6-metoxy-1,4-benzoquinol methylase
MKTVDHNNEYDRGKSVSASASPELEQFYLTGGALKLWDDKDAWNTRAAVEDGFYVRLLQQENAFKILDVAAASGYHAIELARVGFSVAATDGLQQFVDAGLCNQRAANTFFPFKQALWSELSPALFQGETFDAVLCLGGSLHHTHLQGVQELFTNVKSLLKPEGIFVVEQRNYERFFLEKPHEIPHPCGWKYRMDYEEPRTIFYTLTDPTRLIAATCKCTVTFEHELFGIASETGFRIKNISYDYGRCSVKEESSWIHYTFEILPKEK